MKKSLALLLFCLFSIGGAAFAHPGNTASDGCHYCWTNCASWGVAYGVRHCHGGSTYIAPTYTAPTIPTCGLNSYSSNGSCVCYAGYTWKYPNISSNYDCVLKKTATQLCQEEFGYNATAGYTSDTCMCKAGYERSSDRTYCVLKLIVPTCGLNSYATTDGKCSCYAGYVRKYPDSSNNYDCVVKKTAAQLCQDTYGIYSVPSGTSKCGCIDGYTINTTSKNLGCIEATTSCQLDFGSHISATGKADSNGSYKCVCDVGYVFSSQNKNCEIATTYNTCADTVNSYLATDGNCYCNDGYIWSTGDYKCKLSDNQLVNTKLLDSELVDAISWMYKMGLTSYATIDTFLPDEYLTREQASKFFVTFSKNILDNTGNNGQEVAFNDIKNTDKTLLPYIKEASKLGLMKGTMGKFLPFNKLSRAQAIAVIIRAMDGIQDESNGVWYSEYYNLANKYLMLDGLGFDFNSLDSVNIKRGEVAILLFRSLLNKTVLSRDL